MNTSRFNLVRRLSAGALLAAFVACCSPLLHSQTFTIVKPFAAALSEGYYPYSGPIIASDGRLYGSLNVSSVYGTGQIYGINRDGTGYTVLRELMDYSGQNPIAGVLEASDGKLYGAAVSGGYTSRGTLFRLNKDGSGFAVIQGAGPTSGLGFDGNYPFATPIEGSDGRLYGTTSQGGSGGFGAVYRMNKDGTGYTVLRSISNNNFNAGWIYAPPMQGSDGRLYGTTSRSGTSGNGTAWALNTDGSGFVTLHDFNGSDGSEVNSPLFQASNGALYGMAKKGGTYNQGVIFRMNSNGSGFSVLRHFMGPDGAAPLYCGFMQAADGQLYGMTTEGGTTGDGVIFRMALDGSNFVLVHEFRTATTGAAPSSTLVQDASTGLLYGTARLGGSLSGGVLFFVAPETASAPTTASQAFIYTGGAQTFTVPAGVTSLTVTASGAQGRDDAQMGGRGGLVTATIAVTPGEVLTINVGGSGATGGFNGGGAGNSPGGGASDVRRGGTALQHRVIVAAGGGGARSDVGPGGGGGGLNGLPGHGVGAGGGATQTSGGAAGPGGYSNPGTLGQGGYGYQAGGGGGYYGGGGGGYYSFSYWPAGGGSSYAIPSATSVTHAPAVRSGHGQVVLTWPLAATPADTTAPVLTLPANIIAEATKAQGAVVTFTASANDGVDGPVAVTLTPASGSTFPLGTTTVTASATDAAGNTATGSFTVTVRDTTQPGLIVPANITAEATSASGAAVTFAATALDAVSTPTVTSAPASGSTFAIGTTTVNVTATDGAGNVTTGWFLVTVRDTTAPVVTVPANQILEATSATGAVATFAATATDAVGVASLSYSSASGSTFPLGITTVTVTGRDAAGNMGTGTFTVTVRDTSAPVVAAPANIVAEATSAAGAAVSYGASASDAVSGNVAVSGTPASGSLFAIGTTTVALSATDGAGNTGAASFTVTVRDTTAPVITAPANITAEATSAAGAPVTFTAATATDAVTASPTITYSAASGSTFALGSTPVTVTARDAAGNTSTATFTITVRDTTAPVVTAPANITAEATSAAGAAITFGAGSATDTVTAAPAISYSTASGSTFAIGTTTVTVTGTDSAGNAGTATFTVTVKDTTAPTLNLPAPITAEATGTGGAAITFHATGADAVSAVTVTSTPASGSVFPLGTTTVNVTATDAAGNSTSGSFTVTVRDTTAPTINVPANIVVEAASASGATVTFSASANDLVAGAVAVTASPAPGTFPVGTTTVTLTAADGAGNTATKTFTVTVRDTTGPIITAPASSIVEATGATGAIVTFNASASDLVSGSAAVTASPASGSVFGLGTNVVTLSATDGAGNTSTKVFTITVRDTTPPAIVAPANIVAEATSGLGASVMFNATATDAVSGAVAVVASVGSGSTFALGTTTVTLTATDGAGNTGSASFTVTVRDTTAPSITAPANITVDSSSAAGAVVSYAASANDLVSGSVAIGTTKASGSAFPIGVTTVTLTATDAAGNTGTTAFTVTVNGPGQQVQNLTNLVSATSVLSASDQAALGSKLNSAANSLATGNVNSAKGQLGSFTNQVEAFVKSGRLTTAQAQPLVDAVKRILAQI